MLKNKQLILSVSDGSGLFMSHVRGDKMHVANSQQVTVDKLCSQQGSVRGLERQLSG